jgi:cytoskeletal protein RodZ
MDNKPRVPFTGNDQPSNNAPTEPAGAPASLANFDFDRELDKAPVNPGPLMHQQPSTPGHELTKKSKKGLWMTLVTLLVLALVGAAGYFYWQNMQTQDQVNQKQATLDTLTTENAKLKKDVQDVTTTPIAKEPTAAEKLAADKTAITDVITARLHAPTKDKDVKLTLNIMKQDDNFAYVNAGSANSSAAAAYILKKVGDVWAIVYGGQEKVSQADVNAYTIPTDFQSGQ